MSNSEYYKELADYHLTNYELNKKMALQAEEIKEWGVKNLQSMVGMLKSHLPKDKPGITEIVVKIKPR